MEAEGTRRSIFNPSVALLLSLQAAWAEDSANGGKESVCDDIRKFSVSGRTRGKVSAAAAVNRPPACVGDEWERRRAI